MSTPATRKLTAKQSALVDTLVTEGSSVQKGAEAAGYAKGESGRVSGHRALALPQVQQYMQGKMVDMFGLGASCALA